MSVLILNRKSLAAYPYHEWLAGEPGAKVLLTSAASLREHHESLGPVAPHYAESRAYEDYNVNGALELDAVAAHERHRFDAVFALFEYDLIRAARLRARFGLPGQTVAGARVFRDKVLMKDHAVRHEIPVCAYRAVTGPLDLLDFVGTHGYPVVLKPRNGSGTFNTAVLASDADVEAALARGLSPSFEFEPNLIVEDFVAGTMYHVDGLVLDGEVVLNWPSRYTVDTMAYGDGATLGSVLCEPAAELTARLRAFAHDTLRAFPTPRTTAFHAEIFHTGDDRLLLCEVASRVGGGIINAYVARALGVDMARTWLRSLVGLPLDADSARLGAEPRERVAMVLIPAPAGVLRAAPAACPLAYVHDYRVVGVPGQRFGPGIVVPGPLCAFTVTAPDDAALRARMAQAEAWFRRRLVME